MNSRARVGEPVRLRAIVVRLVAIMAISFGLVSTAWWTSARAQPAAAPIPVEATAATRQDVAEELSGLGTVQAYNTVTIRTQIDGQLQQVLFTEGQEVKRGDVLAIVDPRPFRAALDGARAKVQQDQALLENAETNLGRTQKLARDDFATQEALDNQRAAVARLRGQIAQDQGSVGNAEVQLSYTSITSPIDGQTGVRLVDAGNIVHPADAAGLVVITQMRPISVLSTLPEDDLPRVRSATSAGTVPVVALVRDGSRALATGSLSLINNQIDPSNGTMQLKSTFSNADGTLWPGQFVLSRFQVRVLKQALTVPSGAVQRGPAGFFVYVIGADERVTPTSVKLGQIANGVAVIESGIQEGARVVTAGQYRLVPGAQVSVTPASNSAVTAGK